VPVSVWPAPGPVPGPGPETAYVITAFSRPGELVVIPAAGTGTFLTAAAAAGRRVLGLFAGPAACHAASARLDRDLDPAMRALAQARAGGPALLLEAGCPDAGRAALAVLGSDGPGTGVLYTACERVLRPGGVLAVLTASTPRPAGLRDDPGEVIAAARAAGLVYAQHIVALHAAITDGQLVPVSPGAACPDETPGPPAVCTRVHSDLLVFTKPGGTPR
jgi:SAM-dependent methyltransferase